MLFKIFLMAFLVLFASAQDLDKNEHDPTSDYVLEKAKDGLVKFDIVGDTSHLFADEDFEKKEVYLLHENKLDPETTESQEQQQTENLNAPPLPNDSVSSGSKQPDPDCNGWNITTFDRSTNVVFLINGSTLTHLMAGSDPNECFTVMFYVPWCPYSAELAPIYNALPRAFLNMDFYAFDVSKSIGYNTKFGTSAVPMIIVFKQKQILGKFNYTDKHLDDFIEFVSNKTGYPENKTIIIEYYDYQGPVPTEPTQTYDYYLLVSWCFLLFVLFDCLLRKTKFISFTLSLINKLLDFVLNRNEILGLPQPPERAMIQDNNQAQVNHLHID
jgi:thiol-disulfide isomerase/thioredoxin